jgi:hypothetical protein
MFDQVFDNLRKSTEATIQAQQELFKTWTNLWPGVSASPAVWGEPLKYPQKCAEVASELFQKQSISLEAQFAAGLHTCGEAFHLAEAKDPEELRVKTLELCKKTFDCLREVYQAQARDFQAALGKWTELMVKGVA